MELEQSLRKRPMRRIEIGLRAAMAEGDAARAAVFRAELERRKAPQRVAIALTPMAPIPDCLPGDEIWLPVPILGFAGIYEVSSFGRVRRCGGEPLAIKQRANQRYLTATLFRPKAEGGPVTWRLHRLVAGAFIANPDGLPEVNHKDCDRMNNHATNLEWATRAQNIAHSIAAGKNTALTNPNKVRKLTPEIVAAIRRDFVPGGERNGGARIGGNSRELAERFGVDRSTIHRVVRGASQVAPNATAPADGDKGDASNGESNG